MTNESTSVFWSLSIVPVQQWIGEARRSRDLLAGSALLSWLMARLLRQLRAQGGEAQLPPIDEAQLTPFAGSFADTLSQAPYGIPNHASGKLPLPLQQAEALFRTLEAELKQGWADLLTEVATSAAHSARDLWRVIERHVVNTPCPLQLVWCVQDAAVSSLEEIDRLFAAVKRARAIQPVAEDAAVPKCSQCGIRAGAGGETVAEWKAFQDEVAEQQAELDGARLSAGETLCRVCLVKRLAGYLLDRPFPSTSAIAARDWLVAVEALPAEGPASEALRELRKAASNTPGFRGATADTAPLLFARSIEREARQARKEMGALEKGLHRAHAQNDTSKVAALQAERSRGRDKLAKLEATETARRALADVIRTGAGPSTAEASPWPALPPEPCNYLAAVTFDGDDMAKRVRQLESLPAAVAAFQAALQDRLETPGATAEDPLALGKAFYLGGDEGLLLAPVAPVLSLAGAVQELWSQHVEHVGSPTPTLSMGVAVFDRERSLGDAIATAHAAIRTAKEAGKGRLAVTAITASGSRWSAVAPWDGWQRTRTAVDLSRRGELAHGWPHDVEAFLRTLPGEAWRAGDGTRAAMQEELKRLTLRRTGSREAGLDVWARLQGDTWLQQQHADDVVQSTADHLHLIAFLTRVSAGPGVADAA